MPGYKAPLRDFDFCLNELFGYSSHIALPGFEDFTPDIIAQVLQEGAKFCEQELFPLNRSGDEEGCTFKDGVVTTPRGLKEAYRMFCDGGWPALTCDPDHGGQGMPHMVNFLFEEMMGSANLSFCLYPGLTRGAYVAISRFGTEDQKELYAPRLASGEWAGAMCLTEAGSGTDLGLLKTLANPNGDGSYAVTGTKIFISAGDHDITSNIVYLVLARLPDAPKGTKGISLLLVPKFFSGADGTLGERNTASCGSIEHKMGMAASSTCTMNFDGAKGWLVGEPHQGLKAMFAMMNTERIAVGVQGLSVAEASYQNAVAYARERLQGRSPMGPRFPDRPADPIIVHPDVRRMLMLQRAMAEGGRMLALWTAQALDVSERHDDPVVRGQADSFVALMTPVVKAFLTDLGSDAANLGIQILGGHGFIRANGQEQYVRDIRVTQLYEGTNGVQSLDLLGRKVLQMNLLDHLTRPVMSFIEQHGDSESLAEFSSPLSAALDLLQDATDSVRSAASANPEEVSATAVDYLRLFALTALAFLWARAAEVSLPKSNDEFHRAKLATARFYMQRILPQTTGLHAAIVAGAAPVMELGEELF